MLRKFDTKLLVWHWQQFYVSETIKFEKVLPVNIITQNLILQIVGVEIFTRQKPAVIPIY